MLRRPRRRKCQCIKSHRRRLAARLPKHNAIDATRARRRGVAVWYRSFRPARRRSRREGLGAEFSCAFDSPIDLRTGRSRRRCRRRLRRLLRRLLRRPLRRPRRRKCQCIKSSTRRIVGLHCLNCPQADADAAADAVPDARADLQGQDRGRVHRHRRVGLALHIDGAAFGRKATAVPGRCATDAAGSD